MVAVAEWRTRHLESQERPQPSAKARTRTTPTVAVPRDTCILGYTGIVQPAVQIQHSEALRENTKTAADPVADFLPIKLAAQVAGLSPLYIYRLVERGVITRYGGWKITVSLAELLNRRERLQRFRKPPKPQPRTSAGRFLPRPTWVTYDTTDGTVGCGAD